MGSIPARAGEPGLLGSASTLLGLSPRLRGNPPFEYLNCPFGGSIPARAGEPVEPSGRVTSDRVYPRACGGTPHPPSPRQT